LADEARPISTFNPLRPALPASVRPWSRSGSEHCGQGDFRNRRIDLQPPVPFLTEPRGTGLADTGAAVLAAAAGSVLPIVAATGTSFVENLLIYNELTISLEAPASKSLDDPNRPLRVNRPSKTSR
jgi:hypothetical protein